MAETSLSLIVPNMKKKTAQFSSSSSPLSIFSTKTLFYDKLPSEPLRLSVLKLDGTSFDVQVSKSATIAELKDAVEGVFSYMPQHGPGKISWPHVWGQFCLCFDGQKLITEEDYLKNYGVKDGDQTTVADATAIAVAMPLRRPQSQLYCSLNCGCKPHFRTMICSAFGKFSAFICM